jgi:DNA-binding winged helix-turn-helix (wHTH) protein/tetratricopeptide (TPR) repeat protein
MEGEIRIGSWLVQPSLNLVSRNGTTYHLEPKVMEVLVCLAGRAGETVTKDELIQTVWPAIFVSDDGLKRCVFELRRVFEDDAREPRIIETIPKRGYRLIAPVSRNGVSMSGAPAAIESPRIFIHKRTIGWAAAGVLLLLAAGGIFWRWQQPRHLTDKDTVVLGDFANLTGDAVFDGTLRRGLAVQLEQSALLKLLSNEQIRQTLRMMGQTPNAQLTPEIGRELCQRTSSAAALDGSIALIGGRYQVTVRAVDCASGGVLASAEAQAKDKSGVLDALSSVASQMRRKLGESLGTLQKFNTPIAQATTPSLEALQAYSLGLQEVEQGGDFAASLSFFQRATELDPNFAMAYLAMGDAYSVLGDATSSERYLRKAFELRAGVSELERLSIEGDYHFYATGNLVKARHALELRTKMEGSHYAHNVLASCSNMVGEYDAGLNEYKEALRLAPRNNVLHRHLVFTYLLLDRVEEAEAAAKQAQARGLDSDLAAVLYSVAFYRGDTAEMERQVTIGAGKLGVEDLLAALEADTAAYAGHLRKAREFSRRAADSAERAGQQETAAGYYAVSALREALFGNAYNMRQQATAAKQRATGRDVDYGLALASAYAGEIRSAQGIAEDLDKRFPEDTLMQFNYLPTLRAKLAISRSSPQQALDILEAAAPYELGLPSVSVRATHLSEEWNLC